MQFDNAQIHIRQRPSMEALDLGVMLARRYWWSLLAGWLILAVPVFIGAWLVPNLIFALMLLWWFKPLYERIPLTIVAASIFNGHASWSTIRRNILAPDCWLWLTLFRLSPGRSTLTPVAALEGNHSREGIVSTRRSLIRERTMGTYIWLLILGWCLELCIVLLLLITVASLVGIEIPGDILNDPETGFTGMFTTDAFHYWTAKLVLTLFFVAYALVAPFYICSGFALYLNRRIELEGWDIDIGFRKLAQRVAPILGLCLILLCVDTSWAQPVDSESIESQKTSMQNEIEEVVNSDLISDERVRSRFEFDPPEPQPYRVIPGLERILKILMWGMLVAAIGFLLYKLRVWEYAKYFRKGSTREKPIHSNVPMLRRELNLPDNVSAQATALWNSGHRRDALSLLYRGALYSLVTRHRCKIDLSYTEAACKREVKKTVPSRSKSFDSITTCWQQLAYANRSIADSDFALLRDNYVQDFD